MKIKTVKAVDIFPELAGKGSVTNIKLPFGVYDDDNEEDRRLKSLIPKEDPYYRFPGINLAPLLLVLQERDNALLVGPTGVGKSMMPTQLGFKLQLPVARINLHGEMGSPELLGYYGLQNPNIEKDDGWKWTTLPTAIQRPGIVVLDEWDAARAELSISLQRLLEDHDPGLFLSERDQFIRRHPDCVIIATGNTKGLGDATGLYAGTGAQNFAQLNRFHVVMEMQPLSKPHMKAILEEVEFDGKKLKPGLVTALSEFYGMTLSSFKAEDLSSPLSVRTMLHLAKYFPMLSFTALDLAVLSKLPTEQDKKIVLELADRMNLVDPKRKTS
jgi:cobaltochelatase CobS